VLLLLLLVLVLLLPLLLLGSKAFLSPVSLLVSCFSPLNPVVPWLAHSSGSLLSDHEVNDADDGDDANGKLALWSP
jgi:hypothetical protein